MTDAIDALGELAKGMARGGKYYRRVPTGNPKRPWRYYYTKAEYERDHGDKAHRDGPSEKRSLSEFSSALEDAFKREAAPDDDTVEVVSPHDWKLNGVRVTVSESKKNGYFDVKVGSTKLQYGGPEYGTNWKAWATMASQSVWDIVGEIRGGEIEERWADKMGPPRSKKPSRAAQERRAKKEGNPLLSPSSWDHAIDLARDQAYSFYQKLDAKLPSKKATEKSMDIPRSAQMSKGLYSFVFDERDKPQGEIKDAWLPDYVDAFIEEAYEHERSERAHQDPSLLPAGEEPGMQMVNAIYNEFIAYCAKNKVLARAKDKLPVTKEYIGMRLRERGIMHVNSENATADAEAQVAGYHPQPLQLSMDAFSQAEQERNEAVARMGLLAKGDVLFTLVDDENPMHAFAKSHEANAARFGRAYGHSGEVGTHDGDCLFHGRDLLKSGLDQAVVHGAVCTCGR